MNILKRALGKLTLGEAEQLHLIAEFILHIIVELCYLRPQLLLSAVRQRRVRPCVVSDGMPLIYHAPYKLRRGAAVIVCHEEYRPDTLFLQSIEDVVGIAVLVSFVECETDTSVGSKELSAERRILLLRSYRVDGAVHAVPFFSETPSDLRIPGSPADVGRGESRLVRDHLSVIAV